MEQTLWRKKVSHATFRHHAKTWLVVVTAILLGCGFSRSAGAAGHSHKRHSREYFRNHMPASVRADHPAIVPLAAAIRAIATTPLQQLVIVNDITHLLVDYDDDERVYGTPEFHATFDEMLARRRQAGWHYLRDDCDGRAIFAAHLLAALGIEWRLEASFWKEHAWIVARVNGVEYDLLDLRKNAAETARLSYRLLGRWFVRPSHRPPAFAWRRAWVERTGRDLDIGLQLGLLTLDSSREHMRERYATDWTVRVPAGKSSPMDERWLASATAGFPLGEPLQSGALAGGAPPAAQPGTRPAPALSATTSASTAADSQSSGRRAVAAE